ncbi:ankyrin repeat domain-containing protein [Flavobacterium gelatinilyticum]|uniref:ankyrin repeat domain-containing protein n=1 Tax=Flavobacterium gelatinilyticum TaxID=3003260 RepID=UPI002480D723|nr:ankyrin repeat domain-containing protein [Flavobacterium gelatinilyticum]
MKKNIDELSELIYQKKTDEFLNKIKNVKKTSIDDFSSTDAALIHIAALVEDSEVIIETLIEQGSNVNIKDYNGNTPLIHAANYNCPNNIKTLLQKMADLSLYNDELNNPLQIACSGNNYTISKILIENKANVNADNGNLKTPLIRAVEADASFELIEFLLNHGADINYGNGNGTPLMFAISHKNINAVKFLISKGAKIEGYKNRAGEDTLTFAQKVGNTEILDFLHIHLKK